MPFGATLAVDLVPTLAADLAATLEMATAAVSTLMRKARVASSSRIAVEEGAGAVARVASDWQVLERAGGAANPFQTFAFAEAVEAAHVQRGEVPRIVVVRAGGRPRVILPTVVGRWAGVQTLRFLGDPLIQYGDAVVSPDAEPQHIEEAWSAAIANKTASAFYLRKVRADSRLAGTLDARIPIVNQEAAPFVDVASDVTRTARAERELRRCRRRLAEHGDVRFEIVRGPAARTVLAEALELKREWLRARGLVSQVVGDPHWTRALTMVAHSDRLSAARLSVHGRTAAIEIGFTQGPHWHAFLGATVPEFARYGPGQLLMKDIIAQCRAEGLSTYDLLPPADPYKRVIAHGEVAVHDYAGALTASGYPVVLAVRLAPTIKRLLAAMPAGMRRTVLGWRN